MTSGQRIGYVGALIGIVLIAITTAIVFPAV